MIENGTFSWDEKTVTLDGINLRIQEGALVAIVGSVGAGKSSLLNAMLGEMTKLNGRVNTKVGLIPSIITCYYLVGL